jgi:hypothetical protein
MDCELVGITRPAAIAADDVGPRVVLLDQVRLDRPERVRGDRSSDWPSHGSSSISHPWRRRRDLSLDDRRETDQRALGHGHANRGVEDILPEKLPLPSNQLCPVGLSRAEGCVDWRQRLPRNWYYGQHRTSPGRRIDGGEESFWGPCNCPSNCWLESSWGAWP